MKKTKVYRPRRGVRFTHGRVGVSPAGSFVGGLGVTKTSPTVPKVNWTTKNFRLVVPSGSAMQSVKSPVSTVSFQQGVTSVGGGSAPSGIPVVTTSSLRIEGSVSFGRQYEKRKMNAILLGSPASNPVGAIPYSRAVQDLNPTGSFISPSWTHSSIGANQAFVGTSLSSSFFETKSLNYYLSGTEPLEVSPVPASASLFYSKQVRYQTVVVKHTASFFDTLVPATGTVPASFAAGTGTLCALITGTNMPSLTNSTNNPATILISVPVTGRLLDIKVWVEILHISTSSGQYNPLAITGISIKNPNLRWGHAHPIYNDPLFQKQALVDHFSSSVPNFYRDTFLLWEGPGLSPTGGDQRQITNGAVFPGQSAPDFDKQKYPSFDRDRCMRTVFSDAAPTPNPRHLYSPTSPSGNFIGAPNVGANAGPSAYGNNVPWTSDITSLLITDPETYGLPGSPPPGWLSGPGGTNGPNEWPTTGVNYGATSIRPLYPLLDPIFIKKTLGTETTFMSSSVYPNQPTPDLWRGFRPGLRGSEISGTWKLYLVNNFNAGTFAQTDTADMYFRQVRLEITYETPLSSRPGDVRRSHNGTYPRPSNRPLLLCSISGTDKSNVGTLSGSGPDYFRNDVYTATPDRGEVGRTFGIVANSGTLAKVGTDPSNQSYAILYRLSGVLAGASGSFPGWLLNNQFGMPMIPQSSASLSPPVATPAASSSPAQVTAPGKVLDGPRKLSDVARDVNPPRTLVDLASDFVSGALS